VDSEVKISDRTAGVSWKEFIFILFFVAQSVFWLTSIYKDVQKDVERTEYVNKASRRRDDNLKKELEYKHDIMILQVDIKNLKQDLKEAEEDIIEWRDKYLELKSDIKK
jgi:5-bromo-4-chloroindolyl phosphate hydrolysis protein